ncbi:hypothetical protein Q428_07395 [Fervidicella metallireducens AeB]|uniref:Uncharacterized protein n=1 Tax=Fervidicella metallireducens AeB TaxID=1403537 RepID=A0A017RXE4_9CLOT|nr:hypothetical protein [Fervidicella metallireducens]EYE88585.1 hypothetical protein Q428_07395 [Fervidicella metallireducens AeB]
MKFIKLILTILIVAFVSIFGMLLYASNVTENKYQEAKNYIVKGDWISALNLMEQVTHYKDSEELYSYIYPHKLFFEKYETYNEEVKGYKKALLYIDKKEILLKEAKNPEYYKDIMELRKVINFKLKELNEKIKFEATDKTLNEIKNLIQQKNYDKAIEKLNEVNGRMYSAQKEQISNYIELLLFIKNSQNNIEGSKNDKKLTKTNMIDLKELKKIVAKLNPDYQGTLSDEIKIEVEKYIPSEQWVQLYNEKPTTDKIIMLNVGMKRDDLILNMGNPDRTEFISNKYGIFEIMYYKDFTIYLNNNVVTVING